MQDKRKGTIILCGLFLLLLVSMVQASTTVVCYPYNGVEWMTAINSGTLTYSAIRNGNGLTVEVNYYTSPFLKAATQTDNWTYNMRTIELFDTTSIPSNAIITGVNITFNQSAANKNMVPQQWIVFTGGNPTSYTTIVKGDYQRFNDVEYGRLNISTFTNNVRYSVTVSNLTFINKTGITPVYIRDNYDVDNNPPTWITGKINSLNRIANTTFLAVTYDLPDTTPPASITNLANSTATCERINFTWDNPVDDDFNGTLYWLNGIQQFPNLTKTDTFKLFTGLTGGLEYIFSTRTFDNATSPNENATWVNMTVIPTSCGVAPIASFTAVPEIGDAPLSVQFNDTSTNIPNGWEWLIWDNETVFSNLQNPAFVFEDIGLYNIRLNASNSYGYDWENKTAFINVTEYVPPYVLPVVTCENQTGNISIYFSGSTQNSLNWSWEENETLIQVSLDNMFLDFDNTTPFLQWDGFLPASWHALKIYNGTVGEYGRLNCTTNSTPPPVWTMDINPSTERNFASENLLGYWWVLAGSVLVIWILTRRS